MNLDFNVRPSALLGTSTVEGWVDEEIKFTANVAESESLMNKGAYGTKVLYFSLTGIAEYGQHEGWIVAPRREDEELVRQFVSKLASSIRTVSAKRK